MDTFMKEQRKQNDLTNNRLQNLQKNSMIESVLSRMNEIASLLEELKSGQRSPHLTKNADASVRARQCESKRNEQTAIHNIVANIEEQHTIPDIYEQPIPRKTVRFNTKIVEHHISPILNESLPIVIGELGGSNKSRDYSNDHDVNQLESNGYDQSVLVTDTREGITNARNVRTNINHLPPVPETILSYKDPLVNGAHEDLMKTNAIYGTKQDACYLAADGEGVVFGVAKNVSNYQIATYAEKQGIKILNCEFLTKWTEARSNIFKLTIKARQAELTLNSSIWPCGVGVRRFKRKKGTVYKKDRNVSMKPTKLSMIPRRGFNNVRYPADLTIANRFQALYDRGDSHISHV